MARLHTVATEYLDVSRKTYENWTPILSIHTHSDKGRPCGLRGWVITMAAPNSDYELQKHKHLLYFLWFGSIIS
jgi:hypothetical protein